MQVWNGPTLMPQCDANSATSPGASRTPSSTRKIAVSKRAARTPSASQPRCATSSRQTLAALPIPRDRVSCEIPHSAKFFHNAKWRARANAAAAQDQRGHRAGHAARATGSPQVPAHDLASCSAWKWRRRSMVPCVRCESQAPAISAAARSRPPWPRRSGCRRSRATG